jgi:putative spermidine/putrescine transport system ATP-binding protein
MSSSVEAIGGALALEGVTKHYKDVVAVDNVSMTIAPGEFVTLLGSSGSGKTTTLKIVAGFTDASGGSVELDGEPLLGVPPHKRNVGMVFQNYALFPHMTASENLAFPLKMRGMKKPEIAERVKRALTMVRMEKMGDRYPRQLSGGQQQRIAVARAVVFEPRVLLMDEPLGALDKNLREALQLEIKRIHRELGVTVIYVTHDQEEGLVMSDRIGIYREGRIEQLGSATELYETPCSVFTAEFMGESNIFKGIYSPDGDAGRVQVGDDAVAVGPAQCARQPLDQGAAACVVVRPERISISRPGEAPSGGAPNVLRGRVTEVIYLGAVRKYVVELGGAQAAHARVNVGQPGDDLNVGDDICLSWGAEHSVLLPAEGSAGSADASSKGEKLAAVS